MYYTINDNNEINGFYPDDYASLPASAVQCTDEDRDRAIAYQSQGLVMCVTNGKITGERRPNLYSYWSASGKWVENAEEKAAYISSTLKAQIADIAAQIEALESKTYRPMREIQLGLDTDGTALTKLTEYNTQITELRAERAELTAQLS